MKTKNHKRENGLDEWFERECQHGDTLVFTIKDDIKTIFNMTNRKGIRWADSEHPRIIELANATSGEI